ncbi:MAG: COX15/CtaA family protein [Rhodoluna sp.]
MKKFLKVPIFSAAYLPMLGWASLVSQILIVVTGGVVRLTGSGLGCPTWPKCTEESLVTVPEMGIHGIIEFANRLLTFVLAFVAIWTFLTVLALNTNVEGKKLNRGLVTPAVLLIAGIVAQAILGGFTVRTKLNPWFVGSHFVLSGLLIVIASVLLYRLLPPKNEPQRTHKYSPFSRFISSAIAVTGGIAVIIGVLVTGAGPHSGDAQSERNGLDLELWQHLHSFPAYFAMALVIIQLVIFRFEEKQTYAANVAKYLLLALLLQGLIGVLQSRLGLPPLLVAFHMLGAAILCSLLTFQWLSINTRSASK